MVVEQLTSNRRQSSRTLTLKTGRIIVAGNVAPVACAVLDESESGACILVPAEVDIPANFDLILDTSQNGHHCTLKWRAGNRIGVSLRPLSSDRK